MATTGKTMTQASARDHCPTCGHKLHPQEMEKLFRGRKLDCWYCEAPLRASPRFNLEQYAQTGVAAWALIETFISSGGSAWSLVVAGTIFVLVRIFPPGLVHGAPWVHIVNPNADRSTAAAE